MTDAWIDYQTAHMPAPMLGTWGTRWAELMGGAKSDTATISTDATLARFTVSAPNDALDWIGRTVRIPRAPGETDDAYRERLRLAFDLWDTSGRETSVVAGFLAAGFAAPNVLEDFETAGALGHWARFVIYLDGTGVLADPPEWDAFDWDDGTRWDFTAADGLVIDFLIAWVRQFKPAHTRCLGIVVARTGFPTVIVPVDPNPGVELPDDPGLLMPGSYFDAYFDFYLG